MSLKPNFKCFFLLAFISSSSFAEAINDPTRPWGNIESLTKTTESLDESLDLQSILISNDRRIAVIGGNTVSEQETIGTTTIKRIESDRVHIIHEGEPQVLMLIPSIRTNKN